MNERGRWLIDGIFGLWDDRAGPVDPVLKARPQKEKGAMGEKEKSAAGPSAEERIHNENLKTLSKIREKRWAVFVARAVDRYQTWWKSRIKMQPTRPLTEADLGVPNFEMYATFPTHTKSLPGRRRKMPVSSLSQ